MGGQAGATVVACLTWMIATAAAAAGPTTIMAPIHRIPGDPPRIPLTRAAPVDLPSQTPEALVKGLYARKSPILGKVSGYRKAFMPDLARAIALDATPGDVRTLNFDWRYGAPRRAIRKLKLTPVIKGDSATVTARFRVGRTPHEVLFQMFARRTGWRIHDVGQAGPDGWSLRACLHMRGAKIAPACKAPAPDPESLKPEPLPAKIPTPPRPPRP